MAGTALNFDPIFAASPLPPIISQQQNQRKTIEHSSSLLTQEIRTTFNKLDQLWDQVNMEPEIREHRVQQACQFVNNLLNDIVTSEEQMVRSVATDSDARRKVIADLRKFFKKPPFDESAYKQGSIALLKALDAEMNRLANMRDEAVGKQTELCEKYQMFCRRLDILPRQIDIEEQLLSDTEFLELTEKVHELKSIFNKRLERALQLQSEAKKIFDIIHLPTNNSIREEDLQCLRMDLHQQHVVLSQELLDKFSALNEKLKDLHDSWIEEVAFRYDELLIKLDEISAKCFRPPTAKGRENVKYERLNEKELSKLEGEIRKREELYARAQPVFDKLNEWMASWKQKLETEQRVCRASFYKNRAGVLNQKLKQKRMVEQQVPRLFNELQTLCEEYVKYNSVCDIHVDGMRADKYADWVMKGYQQDRDMQRVQKQISSSKLAQTPGRTHNVFSTMRTPTRAVRKLNPVPATVAVGYNPRKRSFSCSQLSDIFPVKTRAYGPTTSTPKPEWS